MIRKLAFILSLLVFTVLTFVALVLVLLDPRDYHPEMAAWLAQRTGRDVSILGGVHYEYFPWLGVRANNVRISQPQGFGKEAFLSLNQLRFRVRILPLIFKQEIQLDEVALVEPRLLLRRTPSGRTNWDDLLERLAPGNLRDTATPLPDGPLQIRPFDWQGLTLLKGSVILIDEQGGERLEFQNLHVGADPGMEFGYHISFRVKSMRQAANAEVLLHGKCTVQPQPFNLTLTNTNLNMEMEALRQGRTRIGAIAGVADFDLRGQRITVQKATASFDGLRLEGSVRGELILSPEFELQGSMRLVKLDPMALLELDSEVDDAQDPDASLKSLAPILENISGQTDFALNQDALALTGLDVLAPGTSLQGSVSATFPKDEKPAAITLRIKGKSLDLDALLPESTAEDEGAPLLPEWFLAWPKDYPTIDAALELTKLHFRKTDALGVSTILKTAAGALELRLDASALAGGAMQTTLAAKKGSVTSKGTLRNVDGAVISRLLFERTTFHGPMDFTWSATGKGFVEKTLRTNLTAEAELIMNNGGFDTALEETPQSPNDWLSLRFDQAKAKLRFSSAGKNPAAGKQPFNCTAHVQLSRIEPEGLLGPPSTGKWHGPVDMSWDVQGGFLWDVDKADLLLIDGNRISGYYKGPLHAFPRRRMELKVLGKANYDVDKDVLRVQSTAVEFPNLRCTVEGKAETLGYTARTRYTGTLSASSFVPRAALPHFGVEFPESKEAYALQQASISGSFDVSPKRAAFTIRNFLLDKSLISGKVSLEDRDRPERMRWDLDLLADAVNLDDYLPPSAPPGVEPSEEPFDTEWLQDLNLAGAIRLGRLRFKGLDFADFQATLQAMHGTLFLRPFRSLFHGGELLGTLQAEAMPRNRGLALSMELDIAKFQLEPAIMSLGGGDNVGGAASWSMTLAGGGANWRQVTGSLGGRAVFRAQDGFYAHSRNRRSQEGKTTPSSSASRGAPPPTEIVYPFSEARATFIVKDGVVSNNDFLVRGTLVQAKGSGTASLISKGMDYTILVQITGAPTIPVKIQGPLAKPRVEIGQREMLTDTVGRIGGSVFDIFSGVLTLPFKAIDLFGEQ